MRRISIFTIQQESLKIICLPANFHKIISQEKMPIIKLTYFNTCMYIFQTFKVLSFTYISVAVSFCLVNLTSKQLERNDVPLPAGHAQVGLQMGACTRFLIS